MSNSALQDWVSGIIYSLVRGIEMSDKSEKYEDEIEEILKDSL